MFKRVALTILAVVAIWLAYELITFPDVQRLATRPPDTTAFMELRRKQLRHAGKDDRLRYEWVSYERISPNLRRAVLVSEDSQFYEHEGVDVEAMREALKRDWKRRRLTHGGSTITQQLAKNLYLSPSKKPLRKLREYFIARSLERNLTKKRILELYLNVVEFGERVYGAEAAARHYFDVPASRLSPSQAALLAGSLPNPRVMNPGSPNSRLRARRKIILSRMRRWGVTAETEVLRPPKPAEESQVSAPQPALPETPEDDDADPEEQPPAAAPTPVPDAPAEQPPPTDTSLPTSPPSPVTGTSTTTTTP